MEDTVAYCNETFKQLQRVEYAKTNVSEGQAQDHLALPAAHDEELDGPPGIWTRHKDNQGPKHPSELSTAVCCDLLQKLCTCIVGLGFRLLTLIAGTVPSHPASWLLSPLVKELVASIYVTPPERSGVSPRTSTDLPRSTTPPGQAEAWLKHELPRAPPSALSRTGVQSLLKVL